MPGVVQKLQLRFPPDQIRRGVFQDSADVGLRRARRRRGLARPDEHRLGRGALETRRRSNGWRAEQRLPEELPQQVFVASDAVEREPVVTLEFERDMQAVLAVEENREDAVVVELLRVEQPTDQPGLPTHAQPDLGELTVAKAPRVGFGDDAEDEVGLLQLPRHPQRPVFVGVLVGIEAGRNAVAGEAGVQTAHAFPVGVRVLTIAEEDLGLAHGAGAEGAAFSGLLNIASNRGKAGRHLGVAPGRCLLRNSNVPLPWIECGPSKNSISVRSARPIFTEWRRVLAYS